MNPLPGGDELCHVEEHEVLVEVVEVPRVLLVEIVGELSLRVVLSGNALVVVHDAEGIAVEDSADDSTDGLGRTAGRGNHLDGACVGKGIASARALPEGDALGRNELGVLVMESVALEVHVRRHCELGQHNDMLEVFRRESLLAALVEQGGHAGETVGVEANHEGRIADELRRHDSQISGEGLSELEVVHGKQVDSTNGVCTLRSLGDHVVDRAHDERVIFDSHSLFHFVEEHGNEGVELGGAGEGHTNLLLGDRTVDLESDHLVEELGFGLRRMEHMRIVGCAIGELPALILHGLRHFAGDLLNDRAVLPGIHQDGGSGAAVGAIDKDNLANMVDEGTNVGIESLAVEDGLANVNDIGEILLEHGGIAEDLMGSLIYEIIDLSNFH